MDEGWSGWERRIKVQPCNATDRIDLLVARLQSSIAQLNSCF
jgi:hypothetical protein